jgi:heme-degrading monooxygenase HmoA
MTLAASIPLQNILWSPLFQCARWHSTEQYQAWRRSSNQARGCAHEREPRVFGHTQLQLCS